MTDEEITSFLAVVKTGTFSGAADLLYITHPALTHRIKSLEKDLGYALIVRNPGIRKVTLTPKGEMFVPIAEQWKTLLTSARMIHDVSPQDSFSIAAIESISMFVMAPVCQKLINTYPNLRLSVKLQYSTNTYEDMRHRTVDFGIINNTQYSKEFHCQPAFQEKMVFVSKRGTEYPDIVSPQNLNGLDSIFVPWSSEYEMWYHYWFGDKNQYSIYLQNTYLIKDCLTKDHSWVIVPASVGNWLETFPEYKIHEIQNGPASRTNYFLTPRTSSSPYINDIKEALRSELSLIRGFKILF